MKLMDKAEKRAHAEKLADKWECRTEEQREKWVKHYMRDDYLDFDGEHVVEVEKPSVKSEFYYDDEYDSPLTDDEEQRKRYFMAENMRWQFKDFGLAEWDKGHKWCIHPLPLLAAIGNGRGGGDYHGDCMDMVGTWAMHVIEFTEERSEGCEEIDYSRIAFSEED